jgi:hypothetical protein
LGKKVIGYLRAMAVGQRLSLMSAFDQRQTLAGLYLMETVANCESVADALSAFL